MLVNAALAWLSFSMQVSAGLRFDEIAESVDIDILRSTALLTGIRLRRNAGPARITLVPAGQFAKTNHSDSRPCVGHVQRGGGV